MSEKTGTSRAFFGNGEAHAGIGMGFSRRSPWLLLGAGRALVRIRRTTQVLWFGVLFAGSHACVFAIQATASRHVDAERRISNRLGLLHASRWRTHRTLCLSDRNARDDCGDGGERGQRLHRLAPCWMTPACGNRINGRNATMFPEPATVFEKF